MRKNYAGAKSKKSSPLVTTIEKGVFVLIVCFFCLFCFFREKG